MTARLARIPRHVLIGAVAALVTAAVHLLIVTISRDVLGRFSWAWFSRDVVWMVPLGYLTVFALISLPLGILAALLPRGVSQRATAWIWGTIITFSVLLMFPRIHPVAWLVVAFAVGYQLSRWTSQQPERMTRFVARAGVTLALVFAALIAVFQGRRAFSARQAMASRPSAASDALNVLLIVWDTARAKSLDLYGYNRVTTPFLDSLAQRSVVFDRAFVTAPWTLPSHAGMFTGQYATTQSGDWLSPLDTKHRTLAEELRDRGYATGGFVANWLATGYSSGLHRGFVHYEDTKRSLGEIILNTTLTQSTLVLRTTTLLIRDRWFGAALRNVMRFDWRPYDSYQSHAWKPGAEVTDEFLNWQAGQKSPFFAFLNYGEAHNPHRARNRDRFNRGKTFADRYDAALWTLDEELARIVHELNRRGELERTVIVVTADHGEQFDEHGLHGHGISLYLTLMHVPLVIFAPGHPAAGARIKHVVSTRDLASTLLDLAGASGHKLPGVALLPRDTSALARVSPSPAIAEVTTGMNDQPRNPTYYGDLTAVVDDSLHFIRDGKGEHHVYAYVRDTAEVDDLAKRPEVAEWARSRIDSLIRAYGLRAPNVRVKAPAGS